MITAPFNFVPLSDKVFYPGWANQVSHDVPFEDGEDGVIELEIKNITPLFTRNGHGRNEVMPYSSHVMMPDGTRRYFIPGTTIKGCVRSVMEILSYGKISFYNNDSFAMQREFDTKKATNNEYMEKVKNVGCGWLYKEGDDFYLWPCKKGLQMISHAAIKERFPGFNPGKDHQTAECKQKSLCSNGELYPEMTVIENTLSFKVNNTPKKVPAGQYQVVCTGHMHGKNHEYLFSVDCGEDPIRISKDVIRVFESVHSRTEYYAGRSGKPGFLKTRLNKGEEIPVFYIKDDQCEIAAMGITRMMRYPFVTSVQDAVRNARQKPDLANEKDLPETIFGTIYGNSLKGRVAFGHAFMDGSIADSRLLSISGVQGQPSASYYPLYVRQDKVGSYRSFKDSDAQIAGRKRYRISMGAQTLPLPSGNDNENVLGTFYAVPNGQTFRSRVVFHNLRKAEIGALIASITMNHTEGCFQNIGLAKSFGYGKVLCNVQLKGLQYSESDYVCAFEKVMLEAGFVLSDSQYLNTMVAIASEHTEADMHMMDLDQYETGKKNSEYSVLKESPKRYNSQYSVQEANKLLCQIEEDKKKATAAEIAKREDENRKQKAIASAKELVQTAQLYMSAMQWKEAKDCLEQAREVLSQNGETTDEVLSLLSTCRSEIEAKQSQSLADVLKGKTSFGNVIGTTSKWIKTAEREFTEKELCVLKDAILALPAKEQKSLSAKRKDIVKAIGEVWTSKLFELLCSIKSL